MAYPPDPVRVGDVGVVEGAAGADRFAKWVQEIREAFVPDPNEPFVKDAEACLSALVADREALLAEVKWQSETAKGYKARVGVLEGALRDALSWIENYPLNGVPQYDNDWHGLATVLAAVLAGGEAAHSGCMEHGREWVRDCNWCTYHRKREQLPDGEVFSERS